VRFHHKSPLMTKQRSQFDCACLSRRHKKLRDHWYSTASTVELALARKSVRKKSLRNKSCKRLESRPNWSIRVRC